MNDLRPGGFNLLPPVIKNLLIINGLFYMARFTAQNLMGIDLNEFLGLYFPASDHFQPYQIITHMFMHGSFTHILFNMFALWMFGNSLENYWGPKKFLIYYFVTGLGASVLYTGINAIEYYSLLQDLSPAVVAQIKTEGLGIFAQNMNYTNPNWAAMNSILNGSVVGASGAVFGLLLAFGMTFPNTRIYLYFAIPVKAKYFVIGYGLLELYSGITATDDGIAHTAHLGGMLFGYLLIRYWNKNKYRMN